MATGQDLMLWRGMTAEMATAKAEVHKLKMQVDGWMQVVPSKHRGMGEVGPGQCSSTAVACVHKLKTQLGVQAGRQAVACVHRSSNVGVQATHSRAGPDGVQRTG